jgi:hypothetical protein
LGATSKHVEARTTCQGGKVLTVRIAGRVQIVHVLSVVHEITAVDWEPERSVVLRKTSGQLKRGIPVGISFPCRPAIHDAGECEGLPRADGITVASEGACVAAELIRSL